jgi:hypothetical protein
MNELRHLVSSLFALSLLGCDTPNDQPGAAAEANVAAAATTDAPVKAEADADVTADAGTQGTAQANPASPPPMAPPPHVDPIGSGPATPHHPAVIRSPAPCQVDAECEDMAKHELSTLTNPGQSREIESMECITHHGSLPTSSFSGPTCTCTQAMTAPIYIGPLGLGCYVLGRLGDCLFGDEDYPPCQLGVATSCTAVCEELEKRLAADAARSHTGEVRYAACEENHCHNVLQAGDSCFADGSWQTGHSYDCALSAAEIRAQHERAATQKPESAILPIPSFTPPEADGFVRLATGTLFKGAKAGPMSFGATTQLYKASESGTRRADIIDPLEGPDDCGVRRDHIVALTGGMVTLYSVDTAALIDGDQEYPFTPAASSIASFYRYDVTLGVAPRFGGTYGYRAGGGTFGSEVNVTRLELPEALTIHELGRSHIDRGPLALTWTGKGSEPLHMTMSISTELTSPIIYTLECLMHDDGAFEIPEAVMLAVPNGFAGVSIEREKRNLLRDNEKTILTVGATVAMHKFAYGDRCDGAPAATACDAYADKVHEVYSECFRAAPPREELCPETVATVCTLCPEYYECMTRNTNCIDGQITSPPGCPCT